MQNKAKFAEFMAVICEMFDRKLSAALTEIYWKSLQPFTDEQCERAFNEIVLSSRFFPKPVDIIEAIQGTQGNQATEAWLKLLEAIRQIGNDQSVKFDDPVIHSVVEAMGGWVEVGDITIDETKWKQREFERLYPIMAKHGFHPEYLAGRIEIHNQARGFESFIPKPKLIGQFEYQRRIG